MSDDLASILTEISNSGKYSTILCDPPWPMKRAFMGDKSKNLDYPTMTINEMRNLPIYDLSDQKSHLWLWTTHRFLPDALDLIKFWGFHYHATLTWVKPEGPVAGGFTFSSEFLVFAYRGAFELKQLGIKTTFYFASKGHSMKPGYQYELIEKVSFPRYLEMFARQKESGWDSWGNEIKSDIDI